MAKVDEKRYFKAIGSNGIDATLRKPFSDNENVGSLLSDIAAIFSLISKPPASIIDLGCGSGWTSNFFALAGYEVLGVDIAKEAIDAAKNNFKDTKHNLTFECSDYDNLKHKDKFDIAVFFDSLHHADDESVALKAAYNTLKPGGTIILCEPGVGHSKSPTSIEAVEKYGVSEKDMPPKISKKALQKAGFKNIKVYAYPAIAHRANYKTFYSKNRKIFNYSFMRGIVAFSLNTFQKGNHGIVIAQKI